MFYSFFCAIEEGVFEGGDVFGVDGSAAHGKIATDIGGYRLL